MALSKNRVKSGIAVTASGECRPVRKGTWKTHEGITKESWVVDYFDTTGTRRLKTFSKKEGRRCLFGNREARIRAGIHVADSASKTVSEARWKWMSIANQAGSNAALSIITGVS